MTLRFTTFTVRHAHINAMKVTRENALDVSRLVGGHMWASSVVLPDRTTAPVGSWVCQTGPRSWAVLTDEEIARWWVAEHGCDSVCIKHHNHECMRRKGHDGMHEGDCGYIWASGAEHG